MDTKCEAALAAYTTRLETEAEQRRSGVKLDPQESLLAIGPESGAFLNQIARGMSAPRILEIGTSFGYSTIWLAEAARRTGGSVITIEIEKHKSDYARTMVQAAGLGAHVEFMVGDAVALIPALPGSFDLVLLDLWKDLYPACLDVFYPKLHSGAIIVADNMAGRVVPALRLYAESVRYLNGMTSVLLPIGAGLEVSRWWPSGRTAWKG